MSKTSPSETERVGIEAETSGEHQYADAGEVHDLELKACPFENQLCTTSYIA